MAIYTVYVPPGDDPTATSAAESTIFVREGFSFPAFLFTPIWLIVRRAWLVFAAYVAVAVLIGVVVKVMEVDPIVASVASLLISAFIGIEASAIRQRKLEHRGYRHMASVVARNEEQAALQFFTAVNGAGAPVAAHPSDTPIVSGVGDRPTEASARP